MRWLLVGSVLLLLGCPSPNGGSPGGGAGGYGTVAAPVFDTSEGVSSSDVAVGLSTSTAGAEIRYTTDGSTPTSGSPLYSSPISVSGPSERLTLKAAAFKSGWTPSATVTGNFGVEWPYSWTEQTGLGTGNWAAVAMNSGGDRLVAGLYSGHAWTSANYGASWTEQTAPGNKEWQDFAYGGTTLIAASYGDDVWTSTNYGASWTAGSQQAYDWTSVAASSDGTHLLAVSDTASGKQVIVSTNSGVNWSDANPSGVTDGDWRGAAMSSDGSKMYITDAANGTFYVSTDGGSSWTSKALPSGYYPQFVACGSDGQRLLLSPNEVKYLYTSNDGGDTWVEQTLAGQHNWWDVGVSDDGTHLVAVDINIPSGGNIWTSGDFGATWRSSASVSLAVQEWERVAINADGSRIAVTSSVNGPKGAIWTGVQTSP